MTQSCMTTSLCKEKNSIETWIHRWGSSASEAILDSPCHIFRTNDIDGFIGYCVESQCAIIYGDPICAPEEIPRLVEAFHRYCKENNLNMICIIASESFAKWAIQHLSNVMIEIGEEIIFNPRNDPTEGSKGHKLRHKVNHVLHLGLKVHEYTTNDPKLESAIQEMGDAWRKTRRGPQIYLGNLKFFEKRVGRRWFYVKDGDRILGAALLSKLEARKGWLLKFLIALPKAPAGTSELLMTSVLETLRGENCNFLTYGMVPAEHLGEIIGLGKWSSWLARTVFKMTKWIFKLNQRKMYWKKFHPKTEPTYILFSKQEVGLKEIRAIMKSLKIDMS